MTLCKSGFYVMIVMEIIKNASKTNKKTCKCHINALSNKEKCIDIEY